MQAGSNLEMPAPGLDSARQIVVAVQNGNLTMGEVDFCVDGLLDAIFRLTENLNGKKVKFKETDHHNLAKRVAAESAVLLKNTEDILPLKAGTKVAIIGDFALEPRYQGAGSSMVNATYVETIERKAREYDLQVVGLSGGYKRTGEVDAALQKEALDYAAEADVILYFFGLDESVNRKGLIGII